MSQVDITQIPAVMRSNQWFIAATLLEQWFNQPANADSFRASPDTTTINMDNWVLKFSRAQQVYNTMLAEKIWRRPQAQTVIVNMLKRQGKLGVEPQSFGDFSQPVPVIDQNYIQYRTLGYMFWDPVDDLFAALGRVTFRMAITGQVLPKSHGGYIIQIKKIGIYLRDSYDFNGSQHLGYWNIEKQYGGKNFFRGSLVRNADFRHWREQQGKGGDYLVFSDLKVIQLPAEGEILTI
jgi:hypothetical protein